jgi:hypothetical protein
MRGISEWKEDNGLTSETPNYFRGFASHHLSGFVVGQGGRVTKEIIVGGCTKRNENNRERRGSSENVRGKPLAA